MSRIGNDPINIPEGVTVQFDNNTINVKGKLGELSQEINPAISILIDDNTIKFSRANDQKENRSIMIIFQSKFGHCIEIIDNLLKLQLTSFNATYI